MHKKPKHIDIIDKAIMAPWQYMNWHGDSPTEGIFKNLIHRPENKITLLAGVSAAALNISLDYSVASLAYAFTTVAVYNLLSSFSPLNDKSNNQYYLETYPETFIDIGKQSRELIRQNKMGWLKNIFYSSSVAVAVASIPQYLTQSQEIIPAIASTSATFSYIFSLNACQDYRVSRIADGHWNYITGSAPPEAKSEKAETTAEITTPAPVHN